MPDFIAVYPPGLTYDKMRGTSKFTRWACSVSNLNFDTQICSLNSHLANCGMVGLKIAMERRTNAYTAVIMDRLDAKILCRHRLSGVSSYMK